MPREILLLLMLAAVPATISGAIQLRVRSVAEMTAASAGADAVTMSEVAAWKNVLWVDARSAESFAAAYIPGAVLLNSEEWDSLLPMFLDAWDPDGQVVVYCDTAACDASARIALRLREEVGLEEVYHLKGGWEAWEAAH